MCGADDDVVSDLLVPGLRAPDPLLFLPGGISGYQHRVGFHGVGILHSPGTNNGLARSLARPRPLGDPDPGRASVRSAVNHLRGPVQPQRRTVRPRTVASALYDMLVQLSNIIGANFGSSGPLFECAVTD